MSQNAVKSIDLERFRGLKANQVRLLLEADCRAMYATSDDDVEAVWKLYDQAGFRFGFTQQAKISYAEATEKRGVLGVAEQWWQAVNPACLHEFIVRRAWIAPDKVDRQEFSDDEISKMGKVCLKKGNLEEALGFFRLCSNTVGIHQVRLRAIRRGNSELVEEAAKFEKSPLTKQECEVMLVWVMNQGSVDKAIEIAKRYKLTAEWRKPLMDLVIKSVHLYSEFIRYTQALEAVSTVAQVEAVYNRIRTRGSVDDEVAIVEFLSKISKRWQKRLPRILLEARNCKLDSWSIRQAQKYGKKCGKPLTIDELMGILDQLRERARGDAPQWAVLDYEFAMKYLASQIVRKVGRKR